MSLKPKPPRYIARAEQWQAVKQPAVQRQLELVGAMHSPLLLLLAFFVYSGVIIYFSFSKFIFAHVKDEIA